MKATQRVKRWVWGAAWSAVCSTAIVATPQAASAQASSMLGPKDGAGLPATDTGRVAIGTSAPDFTLAAKDGPPVTLSQFRGKKSTVLVFYRGHW